MRSERPEQQSTIRFNVFIEHESNGNRQFEGAYQFANTSNELSVGNHIAKDQRNGNDEHK